jgi:hypothetical protein
MADPVVFADWANFPPDVAPFIDQAIQRAFHLKIINKIKATPEVWTGLAGQVMVAAATLDGDSPASLAGADPVLFANKSVAAFKPNQVPLTGATNLTDNNHCGRMLICTNTSAMALTANLNADPAVGVSNGFHCDILHCVSAAAITITAGTGLTLRNVDAHTRVTDGGIARLTVIGTDLYFFGYTES